MRLRTLREEFPDLEVDHRAFVLVPQEGSRPSFTEYHLSHRRAAAQMTSLPFGLPKVGDPYPRSSWPALQAAGWVRLHRPEEFEAFDSALFRAFFEQNLDISELSVLTQVSGIADLGMMPREEIAAEHEQALRLGIRSIPSVVFGPEVISGAREYVAYSQAHIRAG